MGRPEAAYEPRSYPPGVPCWIDVLHTELDPHERFYGALFGWEFEDRVSAASAKNSCIYSAATRAGCMVAGIAASEQAAVDSSWVTYVAVASISQTLRRATAVGGELLAGPFDASPAARWALLVDPTGARFGIWEGEAHGGAELVNQEGAWVLSVLHTTDVQKARKFYTSMFGWRYDVVETPTGELILCRLPGYVGGREDQGAPRDVCAVMLSLDSSRGGGTPIDSTWMPEFWVNDLDSAARDIETLGGLVTASEYRRPGFTRALLVADPGGARLVVSTQNGD